MKKATIKTKHQPIGWSIYKVMQNGLLVKAFYDKKEAIELRDKLNNNAN